MRNPLTMILAAEAPPPAFPIIKRGKNACLLAVSFWSEMQTANFLLDTFRKDKKPKLF